MLVCEIASILSGPQRVNDVGRQIFLSITQAFLLTEIS